MPEATAWPFWTHGAKYPCCRSIWLKYEVDLRIVPSHDPWQGEGNCAPILRFSEASHQKIDSWYPIYHYIPWRQETAPYACNRRLVCHLNSLKLSSFFSVLSVIEHDNEENAEMALKLIYELQKFYRTTHFILVSDSSLYKMGVGWGCWRSRSPSHSLLKSADQPQWKAYWDNSNTRGTHA